MHSTPSLDSNLNAGSYKVHLTEAPLLEIGYFAVYNVSLPIIYSGFQYLSKCKPMQDDQFCTSPSVSMDRLGKKVECFPGLKADRFSPIGTVYEIEVAYQVTKTARFG